MLASHRLDVDQTRLKEGLDDVVMSCVNSVGVEVSKRRQRAAFVCIGPQLIAGQEHRGISQPERTL